jgi:hypothetical protein
MADSVLGSRRSLTAVLLPGRGYGPDRPLLHYAQRCLTTAGYRVSVVHWPAGKLSDRDVVRLAQEAAGCVRGRPPGSMVLVAKSLGSYAIPWAAEQGLPGIWLTPLLTDPGVRAALSSLPGGSLLVGGTADPYWDGDAAAGSGLPVLQVAGADHSLEVPGDPQRSIGALGRVVTAISEVLAALRPVQPAVGR